MIRNTSALVKGSPSTRKARRFALDILDAAIRAVDPRILVQKAVKSEGHLLRFAGKLQNISDVNGIYVIGAGKATGRMAEGVESILKDHVTGGLIVVPKKTINDYELKYIQVKSGGHPVPTKSSVHATKTLLKVISQTPQDALIISLISGGGSALLTLPSPSISLGDLQQTTELLLRSGLSINQINAIRKHLSQVKGGQLVLQIHPRHHWSLIISDVPGDQPDMIASGPTLPDSTSFQMVAAILKNHLLWDEVPISVRDHIRSGMLGNISETPKSENPIFSQTHMQVIGSNRNACEAAQERASSIGVSAKILSTNCQGEARNVGSKFAQDALNLVTPNKALIIGSETTVTVKHRGKGGRNTELLTAAIPLIQDQDGLVIASIATDGIDGSTPYAGGIIDGNTHFRVKSLGLVPEQVLEENNTFLLFDALEDHIDTGPTHTNVRDLTIIVRAKSRT